MGMVAIQSKRVSRDCCKEDTKILCWNIRGLNRCDKQLKVKIMLNLHHIKLFSLLETKIKAPKLGDLYLNLCPGWNFTTNLSCCSSSRIVIGWDPSSFNLNILAMTNQSVHCELTSLSTCLKFCVTFIYGMNDKADRAKLWDHLCDIALNCSSAWVVMGDFNALMDIDDRIGAPVRLNDIQPMRNCMNSCQLDTIKTTGRLYTWTNKQEGISRVFSRIDRVLANSQWGDMFPDAEANFLPKGDFDHCPMVLCCFPTIHVKRPFRFYNVWTTSDRFISLVEQNWKKSVHGCPMFRLTQKLKWLKTDLKALNKQSFNDVEADDLKMHGLLLEAQSKMHADPRNTSLATLEKEAAAAYLKAHTAYTSFIQQRAKIDWLEFGDENSRLFHQSIKQRRKKTVFTPYIPSLMNGSSPHRE
ncbi:uncharacterized protein [Spinacia oleracea]|uniref:Endonuclease/exonuclease/phosphatase domain-containing protein n=1 Tax=Spinacia oleracea TaxID=3562 RepID=A0A9R0JRZ5_SPIOL|nr:uncharacterized protein LOC110784660 [Spinacia oleracea]